MKETVDREWAAYKGVPSVKALDVNGDPIETNSVNTFRDKLAARIWAGESEEFRQSVIEEAEEDLQQQHAEKKKMEADPRTPEEYNRYVRLSYVQMFVLNHYRAIKNCGRPVQVLADKLRRRYGMNVTIILAGPHPEDNGEIGVQRSVPRALLTSFADLTSLKHPLGANPRSPTEEMVSMGPRWVRGGSEVNGTILGGVL